MAVSQRFCTSCRSLLGADDKFCGKCGQPAAGAAPAAATGQPGAQSEPAPEPQPPAGPPTDAGPRSAADPSEPILGIIPNLQRRKSMLSYEALNLVVTPRRMIFAVMTAEQLRQAAREAADSSKAEGKGFLGRAWATMTSGYTFHQRLGELSPDQIVALTPQSWQLELGRIRSVRLRAGNQRNRQPDEIIVNSAGGRYILTHQDLDFRAARDLLRRVVPDVR